MSQPASLKIPTPKDRAFGEYRNDVGHRCPCYEGDLARHRMEPGPPQYEIGDVYFCFAKFHNPFYKKWAGRYSALSVFAPRLEPLHAAERHMGRPLMPPEWPLVENILLPGFQLPKLSAKGLLRLKTKCELWLEKNMLDEVDHRLVGAFTAKEWKDANRELCEMYGGYEWARLGSGGKYWMKLHSTTNTLEMLRQNDRRFMLFPEAYEHVPDDEPKASSPEKDRAASAATGELSKLDAVDTTGSEQQTLL